MDRKINVINKNIYNPHFNVELLAKEAAISRVQLHRKLKEMEGISAGDFIRNIRLKQAAEILRSKNINISHVAYAVGYNNPSLFFAVLKIIRHIPNRVYEEIYFCT
jgi:AraC-type DNA-binding domain-containing proteins